MLIFMPKYTYVQYILTHIGLYGLYSIVPYRRKFSRHEKFAKSLKTGFSRLFVREMNAGHFITN